MVRSRFLLIPKASTSARLALASQSHFSSDDRRRQIDRLFGASQSARRGDLRDTSIIVEEIKALVREQPAGPMGHLAAAASVSAGSSDDSDDDFVDDSYEAADEDGGLRLITQSEDSTAITGIVVVEGSEWAAEEVASRFEGEVAVVRDQPLPLIAPTRTASSERATLRRGDAWHLAAVNLGSGRRRQTDGAGVQVAVLDTGIDASHPELAGRVVRGVAWGAASERWEDQGTIVDTDDHGTHVAGLVAGRRVGVAPGAQLVNVTMIPGGYGMLSDFVLAMSWVGLQPDIQIVNMSAGIPGFVAGMEDALAGLVAAGVLPVIAVGNEGRNTSRSPGNYREALTVGAADARRAIWPSSGGGTLTVNHQVYTVPDLVAPGAEVFSCVPGGLYVSYSGTSMATPIVSGLAARTLARSPTLGLLELAESLLGSCVDLGFPAERQGAGLVQAT